LLGHSMGGMIVQELVLRIPERVERLVLMDTHHGVLSGVDPAILNMAITVVRERGMAGLQQVVENMDDPALSTPADRRVRAERPGYTEAGRQKMLDSSGEMWMAMSTELLERPDRLAEMGSLSMPTLVIMGEQDVPFIEASKAMAATIPGAQLVEIPDAGHSPQFENPEAWWKALSTFLTS
ncbi:MAG TPA: alpha/beta fold hydrolase, partial [Acidimicrobiales bacterium]